MPLIKSKSKGAFSSNVSAEMHAGKPQKQALAIAYSVARKAATGGGIRINGKKVAPSIGGVMSKKPWKGYAEGGGVGDDYNTSLSPEQEKAFQLWKAQNMPRDSGVDYDQRGAYLAGLQQQPNGHWEDQFKKPNHPTFSDQSQYAPYASHGSWAGDTFIPPSPMADGGTPDLSPADQAAMMPETYVNPLANQMVGRTVSAPVNMVKNFIEGAQNYRAGDPETAGQITSASGDLVMQGLGNALGVRAPVPGGASPVFVGPFGAKMLRDEASAAGKPTLAHPVVKEDIKSELKGTSPKFRKEAEGAQQDIMDEAALNTLHERDFNDNFHDRDVFQKSGWSLGADRNPRKEIPDIGAKFEKIPGTDKYEIKHPAGDFHKIYNLPPIEHSPERLKALGNALGSFDPKTNTIHIADPNDPRVVSTALHELQHVIQRKEGFTSGSHPEVAARRPEFQQEYFPSEKNLPAWQKARVESEPSLKGQIINQEKLAKHLTYERSSGETEARNVEKRFLENLYKKHPEDTEDVTRGLQWRKRGGKTMASGGSMAPPPWFVRSEARGSSGMLKSAIPGRTDKIPLNVPGGSYVLPADIPSALGQGNTMAGGTILDKMFNRGPYGMNLPRAKSGSGRPQMARMSSLTKVRKSGYAEGGNTGNAKIIAAGGEYIIHAHAVADIGGGDIDKGHKILDAFVKHVREHHIKTLKKLPGPKVN